MNGKRWGGIGLVVLLLVASASLAGRAAVAQGCGPAATTGEPEIDARERWRFAEEGIGSFQVVLATEDLVVAPAVTPGCAVSLHSIRALDAASGDPRWELAASDLPVELAGDVTGAEDAVLVTGLVFSEGSGVEDDRGILVALDAADGEERWVWEQPGQGSIRILGQADGRLVIQADQDEGGALVALAAGTGDELWRIGYAGHGNGGAVEAAGGMVYATAFGLDGIQSGQILIAADLDGDEVWRWGANSGTTLRLVAADDRRVAIAEETDGSTVVRGFEPSSGERRWAAELPVVDGGWLLAADDADVVAVSRGKAIALDAATGAERWRSELPEAPRLVPPVLSETAVLVVAAATGTVPDGWLIALDRLGGEELWQERFPGLDAAVPGGDVVSVAAGEPGEGQALRALDAETGEEVWNLGFPDLTSLRILTIAAGTIYLNGYGNDGAMLVAVAAQ